MKGLSSFVKQFEFQFSVGIYGCKPEKCLLQVVCQYVCVDVWLELCITRNQTNGLILITFGIFHFCNCFIFKGKRFILHFTTNLERGLVCRTIKLTLMSFMTVSVFFNLETYCFVQYSYEKVLQDLI